VRSQQTFHKECFELVEQKLDFKRILNKMEELEVFQSIVLTPLQRHLINLSKKKSVKEEIMLNRSKQRKKEKYREFSRNFEGGGKLHELN